MKEKNMQRVSLEDEKKSISYIKKSSTQIAHLLKMEEEYLSLKDQKTLETTLEALDRLVNKKRTLINNKEKYDRKITKTKEQLKKVLLQYDEKTQLSLILAKNRNIFDMFVKTLDDAREEFVYISAPYLEQYSLTAEKYIEKIQNTLSDTTAKNYDLYAFEYEKWVKELEL